jgi:hypothetical protein
LWALFRFAPSYGTASRSDERSSCGKRSLQGIRVQGSLENMTVEGAAKKSPTVDSKSAIATLSVVASGGLAF